MSTLVWVGPNCTTDVFEAAEKFDTVVLIEPLAECCEMLRKEIGHLPGVSILNCACGKDEGIAEFHTYNENGFSSSLGVVDNEAVEIFDRVDWSNTTTRDVQVVNLGKLIDALAIGTIDQLIIDAQGMDLTILRTIEKQLKAKQITLVKSEADNGFRHYQGLDNRLSEQIKFMESCGFVPLLVSGTATFHPDVIWERPSETEIVERLERISRAACV